MANGSRVTSDTPATNLMARFDAVADAPLGACASPPRNQVRSSEAPTSPPPAPRRRAPSQPRYYVGDPCYLRNDLDGPSFENWLLRVGELSFNRLPWGEERPQGVVRLVTRDDGWYGDNQIAVDSGVIAMIDLSRVSPFMRREAMETAQGGYAVVGDDVDFDSLVDYTEDSGFDSGSDDDY